MKNKNIFVSSLQLGLDYCFLLNESKSIFFENNYIEYNDDEILFEIKPIITKINQNNCNKIKNLSISLQNLPKIDSLFELIEITKNYEYISLEDLSLRPLFKDFGYIEYCLYKDSLEGQRWKKIFKLQNEVIFTDNLRSLEIFSQNKEWYNFIFPIFYNEQLPINKLNPIGLYNFFYNETPNFIPKDLDDEIFEKLYIKSNKNSKKIIDKNLIEHIKLPVLYIGNKPTEGVNAINYDPKFQKYETFCSKTIKLNFKNKAQQQRYINGDYAKIKAFELNFFSNEKEFYSQSMILFKKELALLLQKKSYAEWKIFLKTSLEMLKFSSKLDQIQSNFNDFCIKNDMFLNKNIVFFDQNMNFDFYDSQKKIGIDIKLTFPNITQIKNKLLKIRQDINEYYIITAEKVTNIDLYNLPSIVNQNYAKSLYDDLFYWYNYTFVHQ